MHRLDDKLFWSASDLTVAAQCEFAFLRALDYENGWAARPSSSADAFMDHIAAMGNKHELRVLAEYRAAGNLVEIPRASVFDRAALNAARDATVTAMTNGQVVYQGAYFDGEFVGFADFIEPSAEGAVVCDTKLARHAKPQALLQLGAYAAQIRQLGIAVAPMVSLLLGNGERVDFRTADIVPVFEDRRDHLRRLIEAHRQPIEWGDDQFVACGSCDECDAALGAADDVLLVAGLRMDQRRKLHTVGVRSVADLAAADVKPVGMAESTFANLKRQASLQATGGDVTYVLTPSAGDVLKKLPAPSAGDLFFDFEGDPLYTEDDPTRAGLEYLWGVMDTAKTFTPIWAHNWTDEKAAFIEFMDWVAAVRAMHPDMHIYHYAPYETSALKKLAIRYQTKEQELDNLLRAEVFVDLYATVRGAIRISAPSYSIKKLEPLYMTGDRSGAGVQKGDDSIVAFVEYLEALEVDLEAAAKKRHDLEIYNSYDCESTIGLRDWLLERAEEAGVADEIVPRIVSPEVEEPIVESVLFTALMALSGPETRSQRTPDQQAYAMLATAVDYYRRERKQFWWEHFDRCLHPVSDWAGTRNVFAVESAEVMQDWHLPAKKRTLHRTVALTGGWAAGSKTSGRSVALFAAPSAARSGGPENGMYVVGSEVDVAGVDGDADSVVITLKAKKGHDHDDLPVALTPSLPLATGIIEEAIEEACQAAANGAQSAAFDVLARRRPRLRNGAELPATGNTIADVVEALIAMDDSYVAIQGPPGTGKSYSASRVIKDLVEKHHWRIGVVGQSHDVVENLLCGIVEAGLDDGLVGKSDNRSANRTWTDIENKGPARAAFVDRHDSTGCVLGGTVWTFSSAAMRDWFDLLVIDEAGQFSLAPTIGAATSAKRLLLLGDPQQLPQVSQGTHAEPVDDSALGWLMDGHSAIPREYGYFLAQSYRMQPEVCEKVSVLSYEGRLKSVASGRSLVGIEPGLLVVQLDHAGNRTESVEEAEEVVRQVKDHLGAEWTDCGVTRPLTAGDFLIVAPYNAQVQMIRLALDEAGLADARVGTVDKFQGQEAPIAIVSMTASSHGDVPRGMGFVLNRNRINVAVSRAQWRAILIRSEALTAFMPSNVDGLLELGAFIGLCRNSG